MLLHVLPDGVQRRQHLMGEKHNISHQNNPLSLSVYIIQFYYTLQPGAQISERGATSRIEGLTIARDTHVSILLFTNSVLAFSVFLLMSAEKTL